MLAIKRLHTADVDFSQQLEALLAWEAVADKKLLSDVDAIISAVKQRGDDAVVEYTNRFDQRQIETAEALMIAPADMHQALNAISAEQKQALQTAAARIREYAEQQRLQAWSYQDNHGNQLGQKVTAMHKVGMYVPGGKAAYPSSVLMNAIPAKVAGVPELVMVVPTPKNEINTMVLAAAAIAEVDKIFTIGGAQAVAALAYGTATIPAVDKIVGPGNAYVAAAKRQVFGTVGIDMVAGPSEILVLCDGKTNPDWIAMDLFSQAEHDELAQAILISTDAAYIEQVQASMEKLLADMPRKNIIQTSLQNRGVFITADSMAAAVAVINQIAPEHLELSVDQPEQLLDQIHHAGAIFMGRFTPEAFGDYCAGPNHVLPTSRTARFASPLGVYDFQKRSSIIHCSEQGAAGLANTAAVLADAEGLYAHKASAQYRDAADNTDQ